MLMSKRGRYIGGSTVISKNSCFFKPSKNETDHLAPKEARKVQRKILENKTKNLINNCINNIKLSRSKNSPYKKNSDGVTHHYLKEIIILMFNKTNLGIKKRYSKTILDQLTNLEVKNKTIKKYIDKYANDEIKGIMKNFDSSFNLENND